MAQVVPSHPVRVRGLKQILPREQRSVAFVAPRAGAWVETCVSFRLWLLRLSRTPCGCVG